MKTCRILILCSLANACGISDLGTQESIPQACIDLNNTLNGIWHESTGSDSLHFPAEIEFRKVGSTTGLFTGFGVPLSYALSVDCDAILIIDGSGNLVITYNAKDQNGWLALENFGRIHYYWKESAPPDCPASISVKRIDSLTIEQWKQLFGEDLTTGAGAFVAMEVHPANQPSGASWNGTVVIEDVQGRRDNCALAAGVGKPEGFFCSCDGVACAATFEVGAKFAGTPTGIADSEDNVFWDLHKITHPTASLLHRVGVSGPCEIQCSQVYRSVTCGHNDVLGTFIITYTLSRDDALGLTRVSVAKQ